MKMKKKKKKGGLIGHRFPAVPKIKKKKRK